MDTIAMPITGRKIKIAQSDFPGIMTWEDANNACKSLGKGWRLPTLEELLEIHKLHNEIGSFCIIDGDDSFNRSHRSSNFENYWSSDNSEEYPGCYYKLRFTEDLDSFDNKKLHIQNGSDWRDACKVRAVKTAR